MPQHTMNAAVADLNTALDQEDNKSTLVSRNVTVMGHRTSIRLEPATWRALTEISRREKCSVNDLCSIVKLRKRPATSLTAAIRVFVMLYYRAAATEEGHKRSGHGDFQMMIQRAQISQQDMQGNKQQGSSYQKSASNDSGERHWV